MNDISNKTLAVLVVIAIIVSLVGLYLGLGRARIVTVGKAGTEPGLVNVTVISNINLALSGGVNFSTPMAPGDPGVASHILTNCNQLLGYCNITVGSIGTTKTRIQFFAANALFSTVGMVAGNSFNASTANVGYLPAPVNQLLAPCGTDTWGGASPLGTGTYKWVQFALTEVVQDCLQYQGFTMAIQVRVPPGEPSGKKTATLNFVGSEDLT